MNEFTVCFTCPLCGNHEVEASGLIVGEGSEMGMYMVNVGSTAAEPTFNCAPFSTPDAILSMEEFAKVENAMIEAKHDA